jgi:hypothetical protein
MTDKMTAEQVIRSRCQALACEPEIYNALGSFGNDPTEANAISVIQAVAGQIERQALTAPRVPEEGVSDQIGGIGNELHNLSCTFQNHEELCDDLSGMRDRLWAIQKQLTAAPAPADELATLRERVKELEGYNVGLANESHALQERVKVLEEQQIASMALARRMFRGIKTKPNWWLFSQLFGTGRTAAVQRCESLGIDPEAARLRGGSDE